MNVFCNIDLLTRISHINELITIRTNGGETLVNTVGYLCGYGWVWYDPHGIANIISLKNMKAIYRVTFNSMSDDGGHFIVHRDTGPIIFRPSTSGLYFHDMHGRTAVALTQYNVDTVAANAEGYTPKQLRSARGARRLQCMTGHPSDADFLALVRCNMVKISPSLPPTLLLLNLSTAPTS